LNNNYIASSCVISNNTVYKNGKDIFATHDADLPNFLFSVYKHLEINHSRFYKMDNLCKLGWLASEVLLKSSFNINAFKPEEVGIVLSNTNSSLDTDLRYIESVKDIASPSLFVYTLPNIVTGEISIRNNFKGEDAFFVFERFNAAFTEFYVNNLLDNDILEACICGWVDLVGDEYKAALFLVEKIKGEGALPFTEKNMETIFEPGKDAPATNNDVYIAGLGVISAIGNNVQECLNSLENKKAGMGDITHMNTVHRNELPVAEVKLTNEELVKITGLPPDISRTTLLGLIAAKEALHDAGITDLTSLRTGLVSANTVGGMDKTEDFFVPFLKNNKQGKLKFVFDHECGSVTEHIADNLGIKNFVTTLSTACSSSANAIFYAARLIKNDLLDVAIAGGADALTKFTLNGFNTLMILDKEFCKPFDENRQGLNLGEGAGYVVLVSEKIGKTLKKKMYCKLSGYNNSNDAYHQTASSPDGMGSYLAMKRALEKASLTTADIDYINLHGTGTPNNDSAEGTAIKRLFDPHYPSMSSTKSFTGHTLGASGAIEAVFSILAIANGIIYPNLRLETPMVDFPFTPEKEFLTGQTVNHVMSNSFGFGGNCTSLIFSRV
jgi:3-oxoacyl-(acyl-carrier-protein) synthase